MILHKSFFNRRERFLAQLDGHAAIIPAASMVVHHADCEYPFRQNSDFWYLTGFDEPDAVALFLPHRPKGEQYVLFVQAREKETEIWNGVRWGIEGAVNKFGADIAYPILKCSILSSRCLISASNHLEAVALDIDLFLRSSAITE